MQYSLNGTSDFEPKPSVTPFLKAELRYLQISEEWGVHERCMETECIDYLLSLKVDDK